MTTPTDPIAAETHELYLHLLNLKQSSGEAATDSAQLHREIANAPEGKDAHVDPAALQGFYSGAAFADATHLTAIRTVLDRAHHHAVDPRFWRPRWLKTRQGVQYAHPRIPNHKLHHQSVGLRPDEAGRAVMKLGRERRQALGMLLLANVFWGLSFPLIKTVALLNARLLPAAGGACVVALILAPRFLLGLGVLLLWSGRAAPGARWPTGGEIRQGIWLGLSCGAGLLLQSDGLRFTAASTSAFLTQFYAVMIPVWLALRLRRAPPAAVWLACALVLAGVSLLGHFDWRQLRGGRGEVETLLSSVFFMMQILMLSGREFSANRPDKVILVWFGVEAVLFGGLALATAPTPAALLAPWASPAWVCCMLLLTGFCTVGAFLIMARWQPRVSATEAGLMYCFEPIFGAIFALFLPGLFSRWAGLPYANETATLSLLVGGGLITVANAVLQLTPGAAPE